MTHYNMSERVECRTYKSTELLLDDPTRTVREIADILATSKSSIGRDFKERLPIIDKDLSDEVNRILSTHSKVQGLRDKELRRTSIKKILAIKE